VEILVQEPFAARKYSGDMMKKLGLLFVLFVFTLSFGAITVQGSGTQQTPIPVTVTVTTYFDTGNQPAVQITDHNYGDKLVVTGSLADTTGYVFDYWIVNGVVRTDLAVDYLFTMITDLDLKAVFHPTDPLQYSVTFMDANGGVLKIQYVASGTGATAPETLPTKLGYEVSGSAWSQGFTNVTSSIVTVLQYTKTNASTYTVTATNGSGGGDYGFNTIATLTANGAPEGQYFNYWATSDRIVSYDSTYKFTVVGNTALTAVYGSSPITDVPTVTLSNDLALRTGYKTYLGQFHVPTGYTLVEYGITTSTDYYLIDLGYESVQRNKGAIYNPQTNEWLMSFSNATVNAKSVRAYLICSKDSDGSLTTVYNDEAQYQVINGSFESGNLAGWNAYTIWKGESGIAAFINDRVTNGTYIDGYTYSREGLYNVGFSGGSLSWDQSSERMGILRSSDFILAGSGWIGFKLGGGKATSLAYVSVKRTSDNVEVARFGNPNFNNTTVASEEYGSTISDARGFLFQYYFDLSTVGNLGTSYYITLNELSSYNYCILSADAIKTYYPVAPSTDANTLAINIVPTIGAADSGNANSIVNGSLTSNLDNWSNVNGIFKIASYGGTTRAGSNVNDDSDLGVLRSSAFSINPNPYIRFDWNGGLAYDKQIFISVREVGTNIEVKRFVRRDNRSSYTGDGVDNALLDLSDLNTSKLYYLEIADNTIAGWGLTIIRNFRIITSAEFSGIDSGDRCAVISGVPTNFVYVKNNG